MRSAPRTPQGPGCERHDLLPLRPDDHDGEGAGAAVEAHDDPPPLRPQRRPAAHAATPDPFVLQGRAGSAKARARTGNAAGGVRGTVRGDELQARPLLVPGSLL